MNRGTRYQIEEVKRRYNVDLTEEEIKSLIMQYRMDQGLSTLRLRYRRPSFNGCNTATSRHKLPSINLPKGLSPLEGWPVHNKVGNISDVWRHSDYRDLIGETFNVSVDTSKDMADSMAMHALFTDSLSKTFGIEKAADTIISLKEHKEPFKLDPDF